MRESVVEVEYQCKLEKTNSLLSGVNGMLSVQSGRYQDLLHNLRLLNLTTALFDTINSGISYIQIITTVLLLKRGSRFSMYCGLYGQCQTVLVC